MRDAALGVGGGCQVVVRNWWVGCKQALLVGDAVLVQRTALWWARLEAEVVAGKCTGPPRCMFGGRRASEVPASAACPLSRPPARHGTARPRAQEAAPEEGGSEEEDEYIYNPLKLPLGWDGKPIPYWLYKLHGLNQEFKCEICGNASYWGRRAFERHFKVGRSGSRAARRSRPAPLGARAHAAAGRAPVFGRGRVGLSMFLSWVGPDL